MIRPLATLVGHEKVSLLPTNVRERFRCPPLTVANVIKNIDIMTNPLDTCPITKNRMLDLDNRHSMALSNRSTTLLRISSQAVGSDKLYEFCHATAAMVTYTSRCKGKER